jgi:ABC-type multidrug transport system permease subunit
MSETRPPGQLGQMWLARAREFTREPGVIFWVFGFPLLLAVALGVAFRDRGVERSVVLVAEPGGTPAAGPLAAALAASPLLEPRAAAPPEAERRFARGEGLVLVTPGTPPVLAFDAARPGAAAAAAAVRDALERAAGRRDLLEVREATAVAPGRRYVDFLIPGLLGLSLLSGGIWGVGYGVVGMRVKRLLKRLAATPMSRPAFLASFLLHRLTVAFLEAAFLLVFARLAFGVVVRGPWPDLVLLVVLGAASFSGLGLLIASRARNMETANGLMNLAALPMWLLSGVFFATSNFPGWLRPFVDALPLTALNDALRGIVNDGEGLLALLPQVGVLAAWGGACFALALRLFRWQ